MKKQVLTIGIILTAATTAFGSNLTDYCVSKINCYTDSQCEIKEVICEEARIAFLETSNLANYMTTINLISSDTQFEWSDS